MERSFSSVYIGHDCISPIFHWNLVSKINMAARRKVLRFACHSGDAHTRITLSAFFPIHQSHPTAQFSATGEPNATEQSSDFVTYLRQSERPARCNASLLSCRTMLAVHSQSDGCFPASQPRQTAAIPTSRRRPILLAGKSKICLPYRSWSKGKTIGRETGEIAD